MNIKARITTASLSSFSSVILITAILLLGMNNRAAASSVNLGWDANPESGVIGYRIYLGNAAGVYTQSYDLGNVTETAVDGLTAGETYFIAISASSVDGIESPLSAPLSFVAPAETGFGSEPPKIGSLAVAEVNGSPVLALIVPQSAVSRGEVQYSVDLKNWQTLASFDTTTGPATLMDNEFSREQHRFYRVAYETQ